MQASRDVILPLSANDTPLSTTLGAHIKRLWHDAGIQEAFKRRSGILYCYSLSPLLFYLLTILDFPYFYLISLSFVYLSLFFFSLLFSSLLYSFLLFCFDNSVFLPLLSLFSHWAEYQLIDSARFFFDQIDRLSAPGYVPTERDALTVRQRTSGIVELEFTFMEHNYRLIDVGGQRSERKKWIHCVRDSDHQILTNRGFLFLEQVEALVELDAASGKVLDWRGLQVANYDPATQRLRFDTPRMLVAGAAHSQLIELSERAEAVRWQTESENENENENKCAQLSVDDDEVSVVDDDESSGASSCSMDVAASDSACGLSIVATSGHDMYVSIDAPNRFRKVTLGQLYRDPSWRTLAVLAPDAAALAAPAKVDVAACVKVLRREDLVLRTVAHCGRTWCFDMHNGFVVTRRAARPVRVAGVPPPRFSTTRAAAATIQGNCFQDVTAILFVAALSGYDLVLFECEHRNRLLEAIELFDDICNTTWFIDTSIILFLNKCDLFREKIEAGIPLDDVRICLTFFKFIKLLFHIYFFIFIKIFSYLSNFYIFIKFFHIYQTFTYLSNFYIFIKLFHIYQTFSYLSNNEQFFSTFLCA